MCQKNMGFNIDYVIVQAGGRGSRMKHMTDNKPKALVPVDNLPMLFHLFEKYPEKKFIVIGDYKYDVMRNYLECFAKVQYLLIDARGQKGTCAGLPKALEVVPAKSPFMLIWSDLILSEAYVLPEEAGNYVGLSETFPCRWSYVNEVFQEVPSTEFGVAGMFLFEEKSELNGVPAQGEFVRWLGEKNKKYKTTSIGGTKEYGLIEEYQKVQKNVCRPFNRVTVKGNHFIKEGITAQGKKLAIREKAWYQHVQQYGIKNIPQIYSFEPFEMECIQGKNIFEYDFDIEKKKAVLVKMVNALKDLHCKEQVESDAFSMENNYYTKTVERLEQIRKLIPYNNEQFIIVNERKCRNIFFYMSEFERAVHNIKLEPFHLIHGDCTFSNMMLNEAEEPVFIDPRGYFGFTELYGDRDYDWAKLYYSLQGNYDQFNRKNFKLFIDENKPEVKLSIQSNGWECVADEYFKLLGEDVSEEKIKLLHAIIWLSLTTYAWEDVDSILGAYYNGIYYLEEVL